MRLDDCAALCRNRRSPGNYFTSRARNRELHPGSVRHTACYSSLSSEWIGIVLTQAERKRNSLILQRVVTVHVFTVSRTLAGFGKD